MDWDFLVDAHQMHRDDVAFVIMDVDRYPIDALLKRNVVHYDPARRDHILGPVVLSVSDPQINAGF